MVAMTNTEKLICALIGPAKGDIRPLAMSIDLLNETLFLEDGENYELRIGGNIFAEVARRLGKTPAAVTKSVYRKAAECWSCGDPALLRAITGLTEIPKDPPAPRTFLYYMAYYVHYGTGYRKLLLTEDLEDEDKPPHA